MAGPAAADGLVTEDAAPVVLPPRPPGALARYPRWLKLGVTGGLLVLLLCVGVTASWLSDYAHHARQDAPPRRADLQSLDTAAAPVATPADLVATAADIDTSHFPALNDQDDRNVQLPPAPDPSLVEDTPQGSLPRIGTDGKQPWQAYARPFNKADQRPRIALIIADLGLAKLASDAAIARLPVTVTLAFDAQSPNIAAWLTRAREAGHETLLDVPMEPFDYPRSDPGPDTLLTSLSNSDNIERLHHALGQGAGYVGVISLTGSRMTTEADKLKPVLQALKDRGLMFVDAHVAPHSAGSEVAQGLSMPSVTANSLVDQDPSSAAIDQALLELERSARANGQAIGIATPLPLTLDRLQAWVAQLPAHGIALAPVSALVK